MATYRLKYDESFYEDLQAVIDWYDNISTNVCDNFLKQFAFAEGKLKKNPFAFTRVTNTRFRRILIKKIPL